jgi:hypothetical protein
MIIEKTGRTKGCTDCGIIAHNTVMQSHECTVSEVEAPVEKEIVKKVIKKVKKVTKKTKK